MQTEVQTKGLGGESSRPVKRRARIACTPCRLRKVRCDVSMHGIPCVHCRLDKQDCSIIPRVRKSPEPNFLKARSNQQPQQRRVSLPIVRSSSPQPLFDSDTQDYPTGPAVLENVNPSTIPVARDIFKPPAEVLDTGRQETLRSYQASRGVETTSPSSDATRAGGLLLENNGTQPIFEAASSTTTSWMHRRGNFVHFSSYQCIEVFDLTRVEPFAALLLEEYGCFYVPAKPILYEFIRQYFLHIHPVLPVMDEVKFLDMFHTNTVIRPCQEQVPLFLFHAILFLASSVGLIYDFPQLLFVMCPSINDAARARCALMLTYHAPFTSDGASTFWLSQAVDYSKRAGAHLCTRIDNDSREKIFLKRLWWCCILRDRIMALVLRQQLHIKPADFDLSLPGPGQNDFADEIRFSMVYDKTTKVNLVHVFGVLCELAVVLNDVLKVLHSGTLLRRGEVQPSHKEMRQWSCELDIWYERALDRFSVLTSVPEAHKSLILFRNMIYIYYNTAKAFLCHHNLLLLTVQYKNQEDQEGLLFEAQMGMITSLRSITDNLSELEHMGLSQFLPNTFIGFSAFPFIWYLLDMRLKSVGPSHKTQRGLRVYTSIMWKFQTRFESTNDVLSSIKKTVDYIQTNEGPSPAFTGLTHQSLRHRITAPMPRSLTRDELAAVFLKGPLVFLRISITVESSLSHGRFPSEADFPEELRVIQQKYEVPDLTFLANIPEEMWSMCLQEVLDAGVGA
ncbi:hypothetical protein COCC4DRAFT_205615 [Bipolaris maydis ATCC 48331]|nr:uncharacterized protein COCC4DRAFT_205615 [Bipolaris maydis ATCC 48331]ENI00588.1 hypothetical protein COCC4DRAFT_205615 [Bipolaris maydis ATCC 48331]KAJ5031528.1 hypothetical protein J3E73DRAFT_428648 [Bipolaris maydis]KAJ6273618.1 hypothetical protein PSV08DRAFT_217850 [Bipolaris maydis]